MVDTLQFQPGAVEGIVEMTPLSHAAGKGMNSMVELLIKNGANVNYLCSVSVGPCISTYTSIMHVRYMCMYTH